MLLRCCLIIHINIKLGHFLYLYILLLDIGVFMIYVVSMRSISHFYHHFHYDQQYNLMNIDSLVLLRIFQNISYYFLMIMQMKNVNNFEIGKIQSQGVCCLAFAWFFVSFSLVLLIIVLFIKKLYIYLYLYIYTRCDLSF